MAAHYQPNDGMVHVNAKNLDAFPNECYDNVVIAKATFSNRLEFTTDFRKKIKSIISKTWKLFWIIILFRTSDTHCSCANSQLTIRCPGASIYTAELPKTLICVAFILVFRLWRNAKRERHKFLFEGILIFSNRCWTMIARKYLSYIKLSHAEQETRLPPNVITENLLFFASPLILFTYLTIARDRRRPAEANQSTIV